jgi:UDP-glucose 4-epimerase
MASFLPVTEVISLMVLVLGGAGYIGSHVAHLLQERGYSVIVYDDFSRGHREAVAGLTWIEGDIGDEARLYQLMVDEQIEGVFYFAAASLAVLCPLYRQNYLRYRGGSKARPC